MYLFPENMTCLECVYVCLFHKYMFIDLTVTVFDCLYPLFLQRLAELMEEHKRELATIESLDSGAVYTLALKTHIGMSIDTMRYFAGWADKIQVKLKENSLCTFLLNQQHFKSREYTYTVCPVLCIWICEIKGPRYLNLFCAKTFDFLITQRQKLSQHC